jgi:diguanylate cyclase (GGDEF)-like protein
MYYNESTERYKYMKASLQYKTFKKLIKEYFDSGIKTVEFFVCIIMFIMAFVLKSQYSIEKKSMISQIQGFVAVYMSFRFGIIGIILYLLIFIMDTTFLLYDYLFDYKDYYNYSVSFVFLLLTVFWVTIVGIISYRQEKYRKETQRLAITDELTDVYNKRYFYITVERELKNSSSANSLGLILIDVDNFTMYNDLYGHNCGDKILKGTAALLKNVIGENETLFRFEGDEFAILAKERDITSLEHYAKNIHDTFEHLKEMYYDEHLAKRLTISIGVSIYPSISSNKEELISHANTALYQAKNMGEDKVNLYQDIMMLIHKNIKSDQQMVGMFKGLLSTINVKDKYTFGHCERVSSYAVMVGEEMGMDQKEIQTLLHAGLLHDIGKIELPKSVLNKTACLSEDEMRFVSQHPIHSAHILEPLSSTDNLIDYVIHHHERFDGKGYPDGLRGEEISIGARILCVVDCFDAMVSERPYRRSMTIEEAVLELKRCSGSQFDPEIVQIFVNAMSNKMSIKYDYKIGV